MRTLGDNPIEDPGDDELDRVRVARTIAVELQHVDAGTGFVIGVLGPWGSGKTSMVNLVRHELGGAMPVIDFNPWMFSGTEQLVESFFTEIAAQLRDRSAQFNSIADDLEIYGEALAPLRFLPVVGPWIERVRGGASALKKLAEVRRGGIGARRARLAEKLLGLETPVVVVVDDIDRLHISEIRDIFKLVRLTGNFPNLIYVLVFDRARVEQALSEDGLPGRDYLEKILQLTFDVPPVAEELLVNRLTRAIDDGLADCANPGKFHASDWPDVLMEVVAPLIRNMRDVRRYVASLRGTVRHLDGQVALVDVLALEAMRVFLPDVFSQLGKAHEALTTPSSVGYGGVRERPEMKAAVEGLLLAGGDRSEVARAMIVRLFPAGRRHIENMTFGAEWQKEWLRERRVAHPDILSFYLQRVENDGLRAFNAAERAFPLLADGDALDAYFGSLPQEQLESVIAALETYEGEYPPEAAVPAAATLLNWLPRLPSRPRAMLGADTRIVVIRVVLRLLRSAEEPEQVLSIVRAVLPLVNAFSSKLELITLVGHQEGAGHGLVSVEAATALERQLRDQVRAAPLDDLASDRALLRLMMWTQHTSDESEPDLVLSATPAVAVALLNDAVSETVSQTIGSRTVRREKVLKWEWLVTAVGGEDRVAEYVDQAASVASGDEDLEALVDLARRYIDGWRPRDFGE